MRPGAVERARSAAARTTRMRVVAIVVCAAAGTLGARPPAAGHADRGARPAVASRDPHPPRPSADDAVPLWLPGGWVDYAPSGMPDFSQCRPEWSRAGPPGQPGQWTYGGPAAAADVLWWLDSMHEPDPRPPSQAHDGHALVTAYPAFGPPRDDHSTANLGPLVEDLAVRVDTDGRRSSRAVRGTAWEAFTAGMTAYVAGRRLSDAYAVASVEAPGAAWLGAQAARRAGVALLLGVWEAQPDGWRRVGGHYAALAGVGIDPAAVALADPLADTAALGAAGRALPAGADAHSCRTAPRAHDDAAAVSHDAFALVGEPALPGGRRVLAGYFTPDNAGEAAAFQGLNPSAALTAHAAEWRRGTVVMAVDAALALVPAPTAGPSAASSPTATAGPTATPSPTAPSTDVATATQLPDPTRAATPTGDPTATRRPDPTETAAATPGAGRWVVMLPRLQRR